MRVGVFHPGSQNVWQRAYAFQESGNLAWLATSAYFQPQSAPVRAAGYVPGRVGSRLRAGLLTRWFPPLDPARVRRMGALELGELALRRAGLERAAHRLNRWGNVRFGAAVIDLIRREPVDVVWGYNSCSLEVFRWAKARGLTCVLDQSIGHPAAENAVLAAERAHHPDFFAPDDTGYDAAWIARNAEELDLADRVVVGSDAAAATLTANGVDDAKIQIVPYGADERLFPERPPVRTTPRDRPLNLLFAGAVGPRKGVQYLLPALARLPESVASLTLVGRLAMPRATFARYAGRVRHVPQAPRAQMPDHFAAADLFVFPSLFEGGAVVLAEALGSGLGILQTHAAGTGAADGVSGRVLAAPDAEALAEVIAHAAADPDMVQAWQAAAWRQGRTRRWADFRAGIREVVGT
jgi:glycosyltransferase involved in cell wall biosynthesis